MAAKKAVNKEPEVRYLSAEEILAIDDRPIEVVHVPEWNTHVRLRGMTGAQRTAYERSLIDPKKLAERGRRGRRGRQNMDSMLNDENVLKMRAIMLSLCIIDENGDLIFSASQIEALNNKSALVLDRLYEIAQKLNGMSPED